MKDLKTAPSPTPLDLSGLVQRIVKNGLEGLPVEDQLSDFCTRIAASGFPIKRGSMGVRTLHPHYGALTYLWRPGPARGDLRACGRSRPNASSA